METKRSYTARVAVESSDTNAVKAHVTVAPVDGGIHVTIESDDPEHQVDEIFPTNNYEISAPYVMEKACEAVVTRLMAMVA